MQAYRFDLVITRFLGLPFFGGLAELIGGKQLQQQAAAELAHAKQHVEQLILGE
jgi:hypothetical protein